MRTLKFNVNKQIIERDSKCNFDNLVPGTEGYLQANFSFTPEWNDYVKVAAFWSMLGKEYEPQALDNYNNCMIPTEALKRRSFKVQIIGRRPDGAQLKTNKIPVTQNGGAS